MDIYFVRPKNGNQHKITSTPNRNGFEFDYNHNVIFFGGKIIRLSPHESDILRVLLNNRARPTPIGILIQRVSGVNEPDSAAVSIRVAIHSLRKVQAMTTLCERQKRGGDATLFADQHVIGPASRAGFHNVDTETHGAERSLQFRWQQGHARARSDQQQFDRRVARLPYRSERLERQVGDRFDIPADCAGRKNDDRTGPLPIRNPKPILAIGLQYLPIVRRQQRDDFHALPPYSAAAVCAGLRLATVTALRRSFFSPRNSRMGAAIQIDEVVLRMMP